MGEVIDQSNERLVLLHILAEQEVIKFINMINGKMRTPKIKALHRVIAFINEKGMLVQFLCYV